MNFDTINLTDSTNLDDNKPKIVKEGYYSFKVSPVLHERIEKHLSILKVLQGVYSKKQSWLLNAIKEKLESDSKNPQVPKEYTLNVKIDEHLDCQIQKRIEFIKKFRGSYSKKQWLVDAVLEKLQKDEREAEKKMQHLQQSSTNAYKQINQLQKELEALKAALTNA